jgi:hypothetical protein
MDHPRPRTPAATALPAIQSPAAPSSMPPPRCPAPFVHSTNAGTVLREGTQTATTTIYVKPLGAPGLDSTVTEALPQGFVRNACAPNQTSSVLGNRFVFERGPATLRCPARIACGRIRIRIRTVDGSAEHPGWSLDLFCLPVCPTPFCGGIGDCCASCPAHRMPDSRP